MHRLFGKSTAAPRATPQNKLPSTDATTSATVDEIKETIDLVEKREAHTQHLIAKEVEAARAAAAKGNQTAALQCIKRKKLYEKEAERLAAQKMSLIQQELTLQAVRFNTVVVKTQQAGAEALAREVKKVGGVEGTERVLDRLEDALADAGDVLDAGKRTLGDVGQMDDAELLEELEQLELLDDLFTTTTSAAGDAGAGAADIDTRSAREAAARPVAAPVPQGAPTALAKRAEEEREERELAELARLQSSMLHVEAPMPLPMMAACH